MTLPLLGVGPGGGAAVPSFIQSSVSSSPDTFDNTKSITLPGTVTAGSTLIVIINQTNQNADPTPPSGWSLITGGSEKSTADKCWIYKKDTTAAGTEGGTTLTWTFAGSCTGVLHFYELSLPVGQVEVTFATATDDPPDRTPSAGSSTYIFIAVACTLANTTRCDAAPSGYSNLLYLESSNTDSASGAHEAMASAWILKSGVTHEDPGAFTWTGARTTPIAATISAR